MFCNNCGKEVNGASKFCNSCGAILDAGTQPVTEQNYAANITTGTGNKPVSVYITFMLALLGIVFLFSKWIRVPALGLFSMTGIDSEYNMFQIFDFSKKIGNLANGGTEGLGFVAFLFLAFTLANLVLYGMFAFKVITDYKKSAVVGKSAFSLSVLFPIVVWITVGITNSVVKEETQGLISSIFSTTAMPVLTLIIGIVGFVSVYTGIKDK